MLKPKAIGKTTITQHAVVLNHMSSATPVGMLANGLYKINDIYGALVADIGAGLLVSFPPVYTGNLIAGLSFQIQGGSITFLYSKGPYSTPGFILNIFLDYGTDGAQDLGLIVCGPMTKAQVSFQG